MNLTDNLHLISMSWFRGSVAHPAASLLASVKERQWDTIDIFCVTIGLLGFVWAIVFHYHNWTLGTIILYSYTALSFINLTITSKLLSVNVLSCGQLLTIGITSWFLGSRYTPMKTQLAFVVFSNFFLLRNGRVALFWLGVIIVVGTVLNFNERERSEYLSQYHICAMDFGFCVATLWVTFLCESDRRKADAARSKFVASVSHELRTPLNGIVCAAELLLERETMGEEDLEDIGIIFGCGQLMSSLINNVLDAEMFHTNKSYEGIVEDASFDVVEVSI